jgi:hypothetical protein
MMSVTLLKFGAPAPLMEGERVLYERSRFNAVFLRSPPTYRIWSNVALLVRTALLVTDRRCLLRNRILHAVTQEIGMWYPGRNPSHDRENIVKVGCGRGLFGRFLEIQSFNSQRPFWVLWPRTLTLRFYFTCPEEAEGVILRQMRVALDGTAAEPAGTEAS